MTNSGDYYRALVSGRSRGLWPGLLRGGLWAASVPYGWATLLRNRLYDGGYTPSQRVPVPVISIGNLTLGGTGKTPCVEYVARFCREQGRQVAILSRGYGGVRGRNDEALLLEENLPDVPHLQGGDRVALAVRAQAEFQSEVLVLDDGFQHRRLARDLDIVLVDATQPWGHGYHFPRGLLREAPASLGRAGAVLLTRCDQAAPADRQRLVETIALLAPGVPLAQTRHQPLELVNGTQQRTACARLREQPVAAFCGIGNPDAFRRTLVDLGASLCAFRTFPDHHAYTRTDAEALYTWARQQATECLLVTTQKDLVKLRLVAPKPRSEVAPSTGPWALRIGLYFEAGQEEFDRKLRHVVSGEP